MRITSAPVVKPDITITLTPAEAEQLRRVCYYNRTVAKKFKANPNGGARKSQDIDAFMGNLGNKLKTAGVNRF